MTIGDRIKELRLSNGLTQEELGNAIGAIKQTINKYESGTITNIPTEKIEAMAKVFGVSEAYIMGWEEDEDPVVREIKEYMHKNPEIKVLFSTAKDVKAEDLKLVIDMLKRMKGE